MARSRLWQGTQATLPIALSIVPFGIAYGATASRTMAPTQGVLMSVAVFAGTAQFITASMLSQGASYLPVLITGLLVNVRLMLLSAALVPHVRAAPRTWQPLLAHLLTDESFAVSMAEFRQHPGDVPFFIGSGLAIFVLWQAATVTGLLFGANLPQGVGLEYALPATLICLLFMLVRDRRGVLVSVLAAGLCLALYRVVSGTWSVMVSTLVAATAGVVWKRWRSRS